MNKAFVRETDDDDMDDLVAPPVPVGSKNYMTPGGWQRLQDELKQLAEVERPQVVETVHWAAKNGDRSENGDYIYGKKRLREIDRRMRFLTKRLEIAEVVDPSVHHGSDQVFLGATVRYVDEDDREHRVTIKGVDEADISQAEVSWISPIARTLMGARVGDMLELHTPAGVQEIEVLQVRYPAPDDAGA